MRLTDPRLWIAATSMGVVVIASIDAIGRTSPGPLTAVHGRDPELAGPRSCALCHGGWFGSMTAACLECHEPIRAQIESGGGLHGSLGSARAETCADCHSEHHGADFDIVNRQSFAFAGVADPTRFDHGVVGYEMAGAHLEKACADCHEHADAAVLPEGASRFLGLSQDCATCHEDAHEGRMVLACADCHGQVDFHQLDAKGHERHLPLAGGHADVSCRTCHEDGGPHALETLGAGARTVDRACVDCHDSPHRAALVRGVAAAEGRPEGRSCGVCHAADHTTFRDERLTITPAQHATIGFPLAAPHDEVSCASCHTPELAAFAERHPGRAANDCAACHDDPHGGQFATASPAPVTCVECHGRERFEPHGFGVEQHARTALPLTGAHLDTDCAACHVVPDDGGVRPFRGTPATCAACHDDAHAGFFARVAALASGDTRTDCALCHGTAAFADLPADGGFDHARHAGFGIEGAHAQARCEVCHPRTSEPDATGRTFGRVAEHFGRYAGCVTCHADPHSGRFDRAGLPAAVDGRADCARCHVETSFRAFPVPFDHGRWTGFELVGGHGRAQCSACHEPELEPDASGRSWRAARGTRCADCHADPHAGQFRAGAATDCARCHQSADRFAELRFDHERDSRFPLGEQHRGVACAACHKPFPTTAGDVVRYRPLGIECADCHGKNEDPLKRGRRTRR